jgi:glycerol-3-phosphate dehydrogenase (NAD(P)+)
MAASPQVAVLGAGAMGTALARHCAARGATTVLLATDHDAAAHAAWREGAPHPALQVPFSSLLCLAPEDWDAGLTDVDAVIVAVSSPGLEPVLSRARDLASPGLWLLVTKGWQAGSLRRPSEVAEAVLGGAPVASLAGPALAAELVVGGPTGLLVASRHHDARRFAADLLEGPATAVFTSSDVAGAETSSAYKNVVAVAVGLAEGLAQRFTESAVSRSFANARAALFARGLMDMAALVESQGGRPGTVLGLAGAGDLYVTCAQGRNGRFGRLLGEGSTVAGAMRSIGSTVEGVPNTAAALALAQRAGLELPTGRIVDRALRGEFADGGAPERLREVFAAALSLDLPVVRS